MPSQHVTPMYSLQYTVNPGPSVEALRALYPNLMRDCLTGLIYDDPAQAFHGGEPAGFDRARRERGLDWPLRAHSMIGAKRMLQLQQAAEFVIARDVPGDFIETGVWRGGACILLRAVLKAWGVTDRTVWLADSFAGLPPPDAAHYPADRDLNLSTFEALAVPLETVRENFSRYGLLDAQVKFLPGWFRDTLSTAPIARLAILRLDGDLYESTTQALDALYDKVSTGGFIIVDDYFRFEPCRAAVADFRRDHDVHDPIIDIDASGAYWQRGAR